MGEVPQFGEEARRIEAANSDELWALAQQVALSGLRKVLTVEQDVVKREEYSHSMKLAENVGRDLVEKNNSPEARARLALLRENVCSSLIEMAHTDREYRGLLENNRERKYPIHNGNVMSMDGERTMQALCAGGAASAALEAEEDERMIPVAERTLADVRTAEAVDKLPVGWAHFGFSNYLKQAMERYGTKFYDDMGNREFLGFIQWYYRVDEHTMIGASYSVDYCDIKNVRDMWEKFGGHIPEGLDTPTWLDCAIQLPCSEEEARQKARDMRQDFYNRIGKGHIKHYSVDEFLTINKDLVDHMFGLYCDLAKAYYMRRQTAATRALVDGLLEDPEGLSHEVLAQLNDMQQTGRMTRKGAALIEQLIRYATVEKLRAGLALLKTGQAPVVRLAAPPEHLSMVERNAFLARQSVANIMDGVRAGRTYGGCTRDMRLSANPDPDSSIDPENNPQEAFGGRGANKDSSQSGSAEVCVYEHTGCYCCPYNDSGEPLSEPMKVPARKRPGFVQCLRKGCGAYMILDAAGNPRKTPNSINKGNIYETAQRLVKQKADQKRGALALSD